jgi:hypothetical protein
MRIFTVDILCGERRIPADRFPNSDTSVYPPGVHWVCKMGMQKKPDEEKL